MAVEWNPFQCLIERSESKTSAWERIIESTFREGMEDAFDVIMGHHLVSKGEKFRLGGLDILIFPLISTLCCYLAEEKLKRSPVRQTLLTFVFYVLGLARYIIGLGLSLVAILPRIMIAIYQCCNSESEKKGYDKYFRDRLFKKDSFELFKNPESSNNSMYPYEKYELKDIDTKYEPGNDEVDDDDDDNKTVYNSFVSTSSKQSKS